MMGVNTFAVCPFLSVSGVTVMSFGPYFLFFVSPLLSFLVYFYEICVTRFYIHATRFLFLRPVFLCVPCQFLVL